MFEEICATSVVDDGLVFEGVSADAITALQEYGVVSVKILARLEAARITVNVDCRVWGQDHTATESGGVSRAP